jgi:uncharacterized protein (TIGR02147 family)
MVFDYSDYKLYLNAVLSTQGAHRGSRSRLARELRCQTAFISHVLNGNSHFSLEHAVVISRFLSHTSDESRYFILLVNLGRAGSKELVDHFKSQIEDIQRKRTQIKERITTDRALSAEAQIRYYSAWYYAAIHVATSIPELQTRDRLAAALDLSPALISECLEFLIEQGLVTTKDGRFLIGPARMHLGSDSPMVSKLHANWRVQALKSLENTRGSAPGNLHYSTVLTLSHKDAKRVREALLRTIDETEKILRPSPEEVVYCIGMDWFQISS